MREEIYQYERGKRQFLPDLRGQGILAATLTMKKVQEIQGKRTYYPRVRTDLKEGYRCGQ